MIEVEKYIIGVLHTNCYVIKDKKTNKCAIIDPGYHSLALDERIKGEPYGAFEYIFLTHGHFDHIWAVPRYKKMTDAKVVISKKDAAATNDNSINLSKMFSKNKLEAFKADITLKDEDVVCLGETKIKAVTTPGHTVGSVCYIVDNAIFSGDTLMKEDIGRTDFKTGDPDMMKDSLKKINKLKGEYIIHPGHGEETSLNAERKNNIYLNKYNNAIY